MPMLQMSMRFRNDSHINEFAKLDKRLKLVMVYADFYATTEWTVGLIWTHLIRSWEEQKEIYKDDPKFIAEPFHSVHEYNRGADASLQALGEVRAHLLAEHVNKIFPYGGGKQTCLIHDVGRGNHIHFQVRPL